MSICNPDSGRSPAEVADSSRLDAQENWRQKMRTLKPVGVGFELIVGCICLAKCMPRLKTAKISRHQSPAKAEDWRQGMRQGMRTLKPVRAYST